MYKELNDVELLALYEKASYNETQLHNEQLAVKILANSFNIRGFI